MRGIKEEEKDELVEGQKADEDEEVKEEGKREDEEQDLKEKEGNDRKKM